MDDAFCTAFLVIIHAPLCPPAGPPVTRYRHVLLVSPQSRQLGPDREPLLLPSFLCARSPSRESSTFRRTPKTSLARGSSASGRAAADVSISRTRLSRQLRSTSCRSATRHKPQRRRPIIRRTSRRLPFRPSHHCRTLRRPPVTTTARRDRSSRRRQRARLAQATRWALGPTAKSAGSASKATTVTLAAAAAEQTLSSRVLPRPCSALLFTQLLTLETYTLPKDLFRLRMIDELLHPLFAFAILFVPLHLVLARPFCQLHHASPLRTICFYLYTAPITRHSIAFARPCMFAPTSLWRRSPNPSVLDPHDAHDLTRSRPVESKR